MMPSREALTYISTKMLIYLHRTFSDTKYFGGDLNLNFCTSQSGKFELCAQEIFDNPPPPPPRPAPVPTPVYTVRQEPGDGSGGDGDDGFPGWAIALIVIFALLILCCIAYIIFVSCCKNNRDDTKEINNNIYMDDRNRGASIYDEDQGDASMYGKSRGNDHYFIEEKSRASTRRSRRKNGDNDVQIVLAEPQDPKFDDDSFTINTYGTKQKQGRDPTMYASKLSGGRDPTMYIPGQEDRPDPDSDTLMLQDGESSRRYYAEDSPLRPKRDPTMYVAGNYAYKDPPLKPKRDPTMYVEGQQDPSVYTDEASGAGYSAGRRASVESYSVGTYGIGGTINGEEEYDQYGFRHSERDAEYMTSETDAEYPRGVRDPSYYVQEESFRTQDASVSKSERPKKSKKSKKSTRSAR